MNAARGRVRALVGFVLVCGVLAGCGDDLETSTSAGAAAGSSSPGLEAAKKLVAQYSAPQQPLSIPALPEAPAKGVRLGFIGCNIPVCSPEAAKDATQALGWKYERQDFTFTPQSYIEAFDRMLQNPPDVLIYQGVFPNSVVAKQLAEVRRRKIPTVSVSTSEKTLEQSLKSPVSACYVCHKQFRFSGRLMAAVVAADGGEQPNVVYVRDPVLAGAQDRVKEGFTAALKEFSPGATLATLNVNTSGPAAQVSSAVITYLQKHPDVKYLVFALASFENGIPQALTSAGLNTNVKLISRAPQEQNIASVRAGAEFAEITEEAPEAVWRSLDAAARLHAGLELTDTSPVGWHQIVTKDNADGAKAVAPGYPSAFLKAWHAG
jgi:ABC-type sugar transport system substrate-binding protein